MSRKLFEFQHSLLLEVGLVDEIHTKKEDNEQCDSPLHNRDILEERNYSEESISS